MKQERNQNNGFWKGMLIGGGIGGMIGGTVGYFWTKKQTMKKAREEYKKIRKKAYDDGLYDGIEESKQWLNDNAIIVDSADPDTIQKAIEAHFNASEDRSSTDPQNEPEAVKEAFKGQTEASVKAENDGKGMKEKAEKKPTVNQPVPKDMVQLYLPRTDEYVLYPRELFYDSKGDPLGETQVRHNLRYYEYRTDRLADLWQAMGWGEYRKDPDDPDMENEVDDYDGAVMGDEPRIKSEERERYLDLIDKYQAHPEEAPSIISQKSFDDECYLDKLYFDYYDVDNVFIENADMDTPVDAMSMFGVTNGNELFGKQKFDEEDDDNDPDIVHIRNFKMNAVAEITRYHRAFASIRDGSAYIHGSAAEYGGAGGV